MPPPWGLQALLFIRFRGCAAAGRARPLRTSSAAAAAAAAAAAGGSVVLEARLLGLWAARAL